MTLSISQVAARSGLRVSAIRYYEQQGLVRSTERRSGRRFFDESVVTRLAAIELAKAAGFTLGEIQSVFARADAGGRPRWDRVAKAKDREIADAMKRLQQRRDVLALLATCTCQTVEGCGDAVLSARHGLSRGRRSSMMSATARSLASDD